MEIETSLSRLSEMHPELEWHEIAGASVTVFEDYGRESPYLLEIELVNVPGFGTELMQLMVDRIGIPSKVVDRIRRTYDSTRRVELAAIAATALALYHGGGHELVDIALRGSGADYLVDASRTVLEIGGRSRRADFAAAWRQKAERLGSRVEKYYLCIVEFETPAGRLAYVE